MRFRAALLTWLLLCAGMCACAGDQPASASKAPPSDRHYPDEGLLSNYRYANAFFGFSIDLPPDARLRPIPSQNPTDGSIALLETLGSPPHRSVLAISAYPVGDKGPTARLLLRHELDDELTIGVEELHGLTKTSIAGHLFFYYETRRGIDQHAIYATDLDGYALRFVTAGRDPKLLEQLEAAVQHMRFFPPESIGDYAGVGAMPYSGPAIPSHIVAELKSDPPAHKLTSGTVSGNVYENAFLGFGYELPKDWHYGTEAAIMPAVELSREKNNRQPAVSPSQRALLKACEQTLVSAWRKLPEENGQIAYDDFGEVTISAMSIDCFPNVKFPDIKDGKEALSDFMVTYGLGHPIIQDMTGARAFEHDGRTFILMNGVVAYKEDGDALSRRVSVALALTKHHNYVLSFFFAAPHEDELHELMDAKASFDAEPAVKTASATTAGGNLQPGGAVAATPHAPAASSEASAAKGPAPAEATPGNSTAAAKAQADSTTTTSDPAAASSFHPSLLRPGETMQDQQMQGKQIPKKPQ